MFSFPTAPSIGAALLTSLCLANPTLCKAQPELLGEITLQYEQNKQRAVPDAADPGGQYLGSGSGELSGRYAASVHWDLYEDQSRDDLHRATFIGYLETDDGHRIPFQSNGYFKPRPGGGYWDLTASVNFDCDDPDYPNLADQRLFWEGAVKTGEWSHRYRLYTASN